MVARAGAESVVRPIPFHCTYSHRTMAIVDVGAAVTQSHSHPAPLCLDIVMSLRAVSAVGPDPPPDMSPDARLPT